MIQLGNSTDTFRIRCTDPLVNEPEEKSRSATDIHREFCADLYQLILAIIEECEICLTEHDSYRRASKYVEMDREATADLRDIPHYEKVKKVAQEKSWKKWGEASPDDFFSYYNDFREDKELQQIIEAMIEAVTYATKYKDRKDSDSRIEEMHAYNLYLCRLIQIQTELIEDRPEIAEYIQEEVCKSM